MNTTGPPGLRPARLAALVQRCVESMALDLTGTTVVTEAATGAYAVTPVIAAAAGADRVIAFTRSTRFGTVDDVVTATSRLADTLGVSRQIEIIDRRPSEDLIGLADIVTNSGHVRPIDATMVSWMRRDAVVPLMFESWEIDLGRHDVDLDALRAAGIRFAGTNERHPAVDVFSFLGPMAVRLLGDAGTSAYGSRLLLLCDNPFQPFLEHGLRAAGAHVVVRERLAITDLHDDLDAIVVSLSPRGEPVLTQEDLAAVAARAPASMIAQFWGDVPREWCGAHGVPCAPLEAPGTGHMGVLPSAVGPEPIVRLQAGGLRVAQALRKAPGTRTDDDLAYIDER